MAYGFKGRGGGTMKKTTTLTLATILILAVWYSYAVEVTLLGPKQYIRTDGSPNLYTDSFPGRAGTGRIVVQNGGVDGVDLVSGAIIRVNGTEVFGVNDFSQKSLLLTETINLLDANTVSVELRSKPGSFLAIEISEQVDSDAAAIIGTSGGILEVTDPVSPLLGVRIEIPSDALSYPTIVSITSRPGIKMPASEKEETYDTPGFEILPHGLSMLSPAKIYLPIPDLDDNGIVDGSNLPVNSGGLYCLDETSDLWVRIPTYIDTARKVLIGETRGFSAWDGRFGRWQTGSTVTYRFGNWPLNTIFPQSTFRSEMIQAITMWADAVDNTVTFVEANSWDIDADIVIYSADLCYDFPFTSNAENCYSLGISSREKWRADRFIVFNQTPTDPSSSSVLQYWVTGKANYDAWTDPPSDRYYIPFLWVALHEFGHVMGLPDYPDCNDSQKPTSDWQVMLYPCSHRLRALQKLGDFDVSEVRTLYDVLFTPESYEYVMRWGSSGPGNGQFIRPFGIEVDRSGNVLVIDAWGNTIQKFNSNGVILGKWGNIGDFDSDFWDSVRLATDSAGNVYVADWGGVAVKKFNSNGNFLGWWGKDYRGYTGWHYPRSGISAAPGDANGQFNQPCGIAVDKNDYVYVTDFFNNRVQKFTSNGTFVTKWGSSGSGDGQFNGPYSIAVDNSGSVYVTDFYNSRIQKFSSTGIFLGWWGGDNSGFTGWHNPGSGRIGQSGSNKGQFYRPIDVDVDPSGNIHVVEYDYSRIQVFSPKGDYINIWGNGYVLWPSSVAFDSSGYAYIVEPNSCRIKKFQRVR